MNVLCKLEDFYLNFNGEKGIIGKSVKGRNIYYFKVEKTKKPILIVQYAIHAREYITTFLALRQIEDFIKRGKKGTIYFIPAVNPDGIVISQTENPLYKANQNGVDLNVNFDACWGRGEKNVLRSGAENYIGEFPFSEPETVALRDFTLKIKPDLTLSYHSKGEEIYWQFHQTGKKAKRDFNIAKHLAKETGYNIKSTPNSTGGYKDWCISSLNIPAFTIEVGSDELSHPIGEENIEQIYKKNKNVLNVLTESTSGRIRKIYGASLKGSEKSQTERRSSYRRCNSYKRKGHS